MDKLDVSGAVTHRLYRQHTVPVYHNHNNKTNSWTSTQYVKDLERIGRDIKRMIIIDNLKENYCWQKHNGIHIRSWYDDPNDTEL